VLAESSAATNPSVPFLFSTVAHTYTSAPFATAGLVTLAFGVVDVNDFNGTTALSIDKVLLLSAPEPSLTLLCTMGALAVATRRRRQA
jgi:hypothetical protein